MQRYSNVISILIGWPTVEFFLAKAAIAATMKYGMAGGNGHFTVNNAVHYLSYLLLPL